MQIKLPSLGESVDKGTVVNILVAEGDKVEKDADLVEIESDKALASLPASQSGKIVKILVEEGQKVSEGDPIVELDADGDPTDDDKTEPKDESAEDPEDDDKAKGRSKKTSPREKEKSTKSKGDGPPASPSVRRMMVELGIQPDEIESSGAGGRIESRDIRKWVDRLREKATEASRPEPRSLPDFTKWGEISKKPLSSIRKAIASQVIDSALTIPQVTQFDEADITQLLETKSKFDDNYAEDGHHLTLTAILVKLVVQLLEKHPFFNASFDAKAEEIILKEYYNIGLATATERGLVVPVLRDIDKKSLAEISRELGILAKRAREGNLDKRSMQGASFSISNQGGIGGGSFTPMVNPPECAILGVGRARERPCCIHDDIVPRTVLPLALSYDHRIVDGAQAASFIKELVDALEQVEESVFEPENNK